MEILLKYFSDFTEKQIEQFKALEGLYKEWNAKINVISRKDIDSMPQYYVPYSQVIDRVLNHGLPLDQVAQAEPAYRSELDKLKQRHRGSALIAVPLERGEQDYAAILSTDHPTPLAVLPISLWPLLKR